MLNQSNTIKKLELLKITNKSKLKSYLSLMISNENTVNLLIEDVFQNVVELHKLKQKKNLKLSLYAYATHLAIQYIKQNKLAV